MMESLRRRRLTVCAVALVAATCAFPTDNSPKVLVLIDAPRTFVLRGDQMSVHARTVRIVGIDTVDVPNVAFNWVSGGSPIATVPAHCCGSPTLPGSTHGLLPSDGSGANSTVTSRSHRDGGGPWPQLTGRLVSNPAVAFEETPRGVEEADWFEFTTSDSTSDYTIFINYPSSGDTSATRTFLVDSLGFSGALPGGYFGRDSADFAGSAFLRSKSFQFSPI